MEREYRLEIDLSFDEQAELSVIKLARKLYLRRGSARFADRRERQIAPVHFIPGLEHALIELAEANTTFEEAGIRIIKTACGCTTGPNGQCRFTGPSIFFR